MPLIRYRENVGISREEDRRRLAGSFNSSILLLKRLYYLFLQKYRDFRATGALAAHWEELVRARAASIYPIWLRQQRHVTPARIRYFTQRCNAWHLVREFVKYKFHGLVALKYRIKYGLRASRGFFKR